MTQTASVTNATHRPFRTPGAEPLWMNAAMAQQDGATASAHKRSGRRACSLHHHGQVGQSTSTTDRTAAMAGPISLRVSALVA